MADPVTYCVDRGWACESVLEATGNERLAAVLGWLSEKPLTILAIVVVAWLANRILRRVIRKIGEGMMVNADKVGDFVPSRFRRADDIGRSNARGEAVSTVARSVATTAVVLTSLAAILSELGVSLAALFASAGVAGVALGFGAQNLVRDVLAGWFIVVEDRYGVGDTIDAGSPAVGVVERVTLRSTRVRDINGTVWHVANGEIVRVGNKSQNWSRAVVDVVVAPTADVDQACSILEAVGRNLHDDPEWSPRLKGRAEVLGVHLMDPTGITLRVIQSTAPAGQFPVEREFRKQVIKAFEEQGVPLATVPQMNQPGSGR
ncbi:MAG TPA: mechanosensitive ion channel family protein [Microthrixaceae bacterium]|nr:mechanosensitive ion channel family protein [Microthrixaceae bacterium]